MFRAIVFSSLMMAFLVTPALADVVVVNEDFESYADTAAMLAVWGETIGNGTAPAQLADQNSGILTSDSGTFPDIQGQAIDHIGATAAVPGMVNQFGGVINQDQGMNPQFTISPSATQNVVLKGDMFISNQGNERMTMGLRHISVAPGGAVTTLNLLELGQLNNNLDASSPEVPGAPRVSTQFAYRLVLFGATTSPVTSNPNWQYFTLAPELDRIDDADELTNLGDIGGGWHTYSATFTTSTVTLELDLFRDGKTNLTRDENGAIEIGVGADGVDASITYEMVTFPEGFNSLRVGGPSGNPSAGPGANAFDNINLSLIDVTAGTPGDFDNDGDVDGHDFLAWQRGESPNGDPGVSVSDVDLAEWQAAYNGGNLGAFGAVPEPASAVLLIAAAALVGLRRI